MSALYKVTTSEIAKLVNPLDCETWKCDPISTYEVLDSIAKHSFRSEPWSTIKQSISLEDSRLYHIQRIAYLIHFGFNLEDSEHRAALCIQEDRCWFYDGNHRFAAALVAGVPHLEIWIAGDDALISKRLASAERID